MTFAKTPIIINTIYVIKSGRENRLYDSTATCLKQGANTDKVVLSALDDDLINQND